MAAGRCGDKHKRGGLKIAVAIIAACANDKFSKARDSFLDGADKTCKSGLLCARTASIEHPLLSAPARLGENQYSSSETAGAREACKPQVRASRANSARVGRLWAQQRTGAREPCKQRPGWTG
ncbi:hypothetical protein DPQ22_04570 [Candidatus Tokpelaia sp.]|nr:hypothetical protein DPQ22_04570 [Candidatus Tokpelaia sp.]